MKSDDVIRAMGSFGGGLAGNGEVCGAVVGALAAFGLVFSRGREEEKENPRMWTQCDEFLERFKHEIGEGKIRCFDIAGVDWSDPDQVKGYYSRGSEKQLKCRDLVGETALIVGQMLENTPETK